MVFPHAVPLGGAQPLLAGSEALEARLRLLLGTRPGDLPWRPEFGCDLGGLLGQPATEARLQEARWRIEAAIRRWIPGIRVGTCRIRVAPEGEIARDPRGLSVAESALLRLGVQAAIELEIGVVFEEAPTRVALRIVA